MSLNRRVVSCVALFAFLIQSTAQAAGRFSLGIEGQSKDTAQSTVSEFVYQKDVNDILFPVYLLGDVARPGVYYVPGKMDLVSLFAIAGGTGKDAETSQIVLKRQLPSQQQEVTQINLDKILQDEHAQSKTLVKNDVIFVPSQKPAISNNTVLLVTVVGSVIGIVVSALALNQALKK